MKSLVNIPWLVGGRTREGVDCVGLACLYLAEQHGIRIETQTPEGLAIPGAKKLALKILAENRFSRETLTHGCIVFFADRKGRVCHVATYLSGDKWLHILQGCESRMDRTTTLMERLGLSPVAQIRPDQAEELAAALALPGLGWATVALIILSIALSAASAFLTPRPKVGQFRNESGRYGFDQLYTQTNPTLPLPDLFGAVSVAGNSPYQSRVDKSQPTADPTAQKANKVVVLCGGPIESFTYGSNQVKINGLVYSDATFHPSGYAIDPAQTKAEAVDGTISTDVNRPSMSLYLGTHGISVPVDVRAQYDRNFPVYGFAGCAYLVARLVDSTKYSQWNLIATPKGRLCRTFDENGFITATATSEAVGTGDGSTVRFKLAYADVKSVTSVTVGGVTYSAITEAVQTGNVYHLNATKGYLEFLTAPAGAAAIVCTYVYYPRAWTQNPAAILVYLLTEKVRGKGFDEAKIDWAFADALQDSCNEDVTWQTANGAVTEDRAHCDYALDYRKPIQEHLRAVLDSCYGILLLSGGKFVMRPRAAGTSVFSFTTANILRDSFSSEMLDRSQRANRFHIFYHALETFSAETEIVRDDPDDQAAREARLGNDGVVEESLRMLAVSSQSQAERLGEIMLREDVATKWVVELKTTVKGLALQPGDVVDLTHPSQPAWAGKLFRIEDRSLDENDRLTLRLSEYSGSAYI